MSVSDLERSAIQVLAAETGATGVKAHSELDYCVLVDDAHGARVHIHHSYPQWVMARVGRGSSTKKRLDPESVHAALRRARKIDEALAEVSAIIREDGRFVLVDGSPSNSVWLRRSVNPIGARFNVQVVFRGSSLVVTGNTPWDEPLAREAESILQIR